MQRFLSAGVLLLLSLPAPAEPARTLNFDEALALARASSPAVIAERLRIDEARARLTGASLRFQRNPTLEIEGGARRGDIESAEYGIEVGQELELPQRRTARMELARAVVSQQESLAKLAESEVLREVATAFLRAAEAQERAAVSASAKRLLEEALTIAERRYAAGDIAQLDVNLARAAVARADVEQRTSHALVKARLAQLQILLGLTGDLAIEGSLAEMPSVDTGQVRAAATDRADVRAIDAQLAESEAERRLAGSMRWPDVGLSASYSREEGDRVTLAGVGLTLPLFNRGQEALALANARHARLTAERGALLRAIEAEVRGGIGTVTALRSASSEFQRTVLPLVDANERLALESYEVGQIGLGDLLLVRREALDARSAFIDQLVETRLAEVELRAQAGLWPGVEE